MATFVDMWLLRTGIYNQKQMDELREIQRRSEEIIATNSTDFIDFMQVRKQLNGYARIIWYYVPLDRNTSSYSPQLALR